MTVILSRWRNDKSSICYGAFRNKQTKVWTRDRHIAWFSAESHSNVVIIANDYNDGKNKYAHYPTRLRCLLSYLLVYFLPLIIIGSSVFHNEGEVDGSFCLPACWYREQGLSYFTVWWMLIIGNSVSHNVVHIHCMDSAVSLLEKSPFKSPVCVGQ